MLRASFITCILLVVMIIPAYSQIIGNKELSQVDSLPQNILDSVGNQKWLFTHASVGSNMVEGMAALHLNNPSRFKLAVISVNFDSLNKCASSPTSTAPGNIYECQRDNPGWSEKLSIFENSVSLGGWHSDAVNVCMDKFCYIDEYADANIYLTKMSAIEARYPDTRFVYTTMPLTTDYDSNNVLRNQFNLVVRNYCAANGRLLFDIADMESHDPDGIEHIFSMDNRQYQCMYTGYSDDGGHLNKTGQQHIALGWYAVAASIASNGVSSMSFPSQTPVSSNNKHQSFSWQKIAIISIVIFVIAAIGIVLLIRKAKY